MKTYMLYWSKIPSSLPALLGVNPRRHIWSQFNQLNKVLAGVSRHAYYSLSNWESMVKLLIVDCEGVEQAVRRFR